MSQFIVKTMCHAMAQFAMQWHNSLGKQLMCGHIVVTERQVDFVPWNELHSTHHHYIHANHNGMHFIKWIRL